MRAEGREEIGQLIRERGEMNGVSTYGRPITKEGPSHGRYLMLELRNITAS
jgi:hypothetical protein